MAYQVIARKFRPNSFAELVGQPHISQTLHNALKSGRLHHALLFTGPRGTGKTSSARILAKSIRCPNSKDFVPCNECHECQDISSGRSINVLEIDGASNNGVDSIRELRDSVSFMPSTGRFKVYIIDEVHMLSISAFNALLKTLEEPPAHVIFIMATTEVHKIPQTILSRCQRFDFRRIPMREITERLQFICEQEGVAYDKDALWIIARQGDGSMRDSQSLLDQVITFANDKLTTQIVVDILGLTDRSLLTEGLAAILSQNKEQMMKLIEKLGQTSTEPFLFAQDFLESIRNLLLIKIAGQTPIIDLPDSEYQALQKLAQSTSEEDIHLLFDMTLKGCQDIQKAQDPKIVLDIVLLRLLSAPRVVNLAQLLNGVQSGVAFTNAAGKTNPNALGNASLEQKKNSKPPFIDEKLPPAERWLKLSAHIKEADSLLGSKIENVLFLGLKEKELQLGVPQKLQYLKELLQDKNVLQKMQNFIDTFWGTGFTISVNQGVNTDAGQSAQMMTQQKEQKRRDEMKTLVLDHPLVKTAQKIFSGQVKEIKETT